MDELTKRIAFAKTDSRELDRLIQDYLPFIKKEIGRTNVAGLEYEDKLSLGMLVFMNCVRQYQETRGGFLSYASVCIRNRLLDEARKLQNPAQTTFPLEQDREDGAATAEEAASLARYSLLQEQQSLQEEIAELSAVFAEYGLSFSQLAKTGPRQQRSRTLCANLAQSICQTPSLLQNFQRTKRIPQAQLARQFDISEKTIEKHRRYIVALVLIYTGDYPGIGSYLPGYTQVA